MASILSGAQTRRSSCWRDYEPSALAGVSLTLSLSRVRPFLDRQIDLPVWGCLHPDYAPLVRVASHGIGHGNSRYPAHPATARHPHKSGAWLAHRPFPTPDDYGDR